MGYTQFYKKWFEGTPKNAKKSTATLTFSGVPVVAETVTIGDQIYEFVANIGDAQAGHIAVVLGVTLTADNAVVKLSEAINANSTIVTAVNSTILDNVTITAILAGIIGNSITISETCTNATFGDSVTTLSGGQYATPCNASNALIIIDGVWYSTNKPVDKWTINGWYSATPTLI